MLIIMGAIFVIFGSLTALHHKRKLNRIHGKGEKLRAEIFEINGSDIRNKHVYITYTFQETSYSAELGLYISGMKVGSTVDILINRENPSDFIYDGIAPKAISILLAIIGAILIISHIVQ